MGLAGKNGGGKCLPVGEATTRPCWVFRRLSVAGVTGIGEKMGQGT